uniref:VirB10 n=1 Tax=Bartonella quintana TaxID=803 RepID=Q84BW4_BARQI|nr:VirB10 [Bartonella quintana]
MVMKDEMDENNINDRSTIKDGQGKKLHSNTSKAVALLVLLGVCGYLAYSTLITNKKQPVELPKEAIIKQTERFRPAQPKPVLLEPTEKNNPSCCPRSFELPTPKINLLKTNADDSLLEAAQTECSCLAYASPQKSQAMQKKITTLHRTNSKENLMKQHNALIIFSNRQTLKVFMLQHLLIEMPAHKKAKQMQKKITTLDRTNSKENLMKQHNALIIFSNRQTLKVFMLQHLLIETTSSQGASIPCILETAISSDQQGFTSCIVSRDILVRQWSRLSFLTRAHKSLANTRSGLKKGQNRLFVLWNRAKTQVGIITLASPATDALGRSGVDGDVDNHWFERIGSALLVSIVRDATNYARNRLPKDQDKNSSDTISSGPNIANIVVENYANIPPTLTKKPRGKWSMFFVAPRFRIFSSVYKLKVIEDKKQIVNRSISRNFYKNSAVILK